jgi:hypothetical protein
MRLLAFLADRRLLDGLAVPDVEPAVHDETVEEPPE